MARNTKNTISTRITLEGGAEVKRELQDLGTTGQAALRKLAQASAEAQRATTGINGNLVELRRNADRVGTAFGKVASRFSFLGGELGRVVGIVAGAFSVQALIDMTSAWTDLNSRLALATGSTDGAAKAMDRLSSVARNTYSNLQNTVDGFARNAVVLRELGYSTERQLDFQESLNNALVVSGARGQRAEQVQTAINKAMATGSLRGEELNTVMSYGSRVTQLLAEHFGVTQGELRKLAEQGLITSDVLGDVLTGNLRTLRKEAGEMPATIQDAFILVGNALLEFVGRADQAAGASNAIASALIWVADNIEPVVIGLGLVAVAVLAVKAKQLALDMYDLGKALVQVTNSMGKLLIALARNPFGLAAIAIAAIVVAIIQANGGFEKFFETINKVVPPVLEMLGNLVKPVLAFIDATGKAIGEFLKLLGITGHAEEAKQGLEEVNDELGNIADSSSTLSNESFPEMADAAVEAGNDIANSFAKAESGVVEVYSAIDVMVWKLQGGVQQATKLYNALKASGGSSGSFQAVAPPTGSSIQTLASGGGPLNGPGTSTSDSIFARLSRGEFVVKAAAVRKYGSGLLNAINGMRLPGFAEGGGISMPRMRLGSIPDLAAGGGGGSGRPLTLVLDGQAFDGLTAPDSVADSLISYANGRRVRMGGRKPSWFVS